MTSEELANAVTETIRSVESRIIGIGQEQYSQGDIQKIEVKPLKGVLDDLIEELDDALVYTAVLRLRCSKLKSILNRLT